MDRPNTPSGMPTPQKVAKNDQNLTKLLNETNDEPEHELVNGGIKEDLLNAIHSSPFTDTRTVIAQTDGLWDDDSRDSDPSDLIGQGSRDSRGEHSIGQEVDHFEIYSLDGQCDLKDGSDDEDPVPVHMRNRVGTPANTKRPLSESSPSSQNGHINMSAKKTRPSNSPSASANLFPKVYNRMGDNPKTMGSPVNGEPELLDISRSDDELNENSSMDENDVIYHNNRVCQQQSGLTATTPRRRVVLKSSPSARVSKEDDSHHGYRPRDQEYRCQEPDSSDDETTYRRINREGTVYGRKPHEPKVTCPDDFDLVKQYQRPTQRQRQGANAGADIKREEELNVPIQFVKGGKRLPTPKRNQAQCSQKVSC